MCIDDDDTVSAATGGYDCTTLATYGLCDTYACSTCSLTGLCDASCGYCSSSVDTPSTSTPTGTPTRTPMVLLSIALTGLSCSAYGTVEESVMNAALGDVISAASFSDHVCSDGSRRTTRSRRLTSVVSISMEVTVPTASLADDGGDTVGSVTSSVNSAISSGSLASSVASYATSSGSAAMTGVSVESASVDTFTPSPAPTGLPTPMPTAAPTTSHHPTPEPSTAHPTVIPIPSPSNNPTPVPTSSPTSSQAPTLTGEYDISTYTELIDAVGSAEDGREWALTLKNDVIANTSIVIASNTQIKVVGSSALGHRAQVQGSASFGWLTDSVTGSRNVTLWLENLEIVGFGDTIEVPAYSSATVSNCRFTANRYGLTIFEHSSATVSNCRFGENTQLGLSVLGPHSTALVHDSEFIRNIARSSFGAAIAVGRVSEDGVDLRNCFVEVSNTTFAHNIGLNGLAVYVYPGNEATIRKCILEDNRATVDGGAVYCARSEWGAIKTLRIYDSIFRNNTAAGDGGALLIQEGVELEIFNTTLSANVASIGGAAHTASNVIIRGSNLVGNRALSGAGGALFTTGGDVNIIDCNLTDNQAAMHGGAVRSEGGAMFLPRGATHFARNRAQESGGAVSLDGSSMKSNEAALIFSDNEARIGGAMSVMNEASAFISAGCQTIQFEMHWALSSPSRFASPSAFLRRIQNTSTTEPTYSGDLVDERGDWMRLIPSLTVDSSVSMCLAPGEYEIAGYEGGACTRRDGWGGGFVRVLDLMGAKLIDDFTVDAIECAATAILTISVDSTLTGYKGDVQFERNRATGSSQQFCGAGCGGAVYVGEECTAELDHIDFSLNSAAHGGALFVDLGGVLLLSRSAMHKNIASSGNGGAVNAGTIANVIVNQIVASRNSASGTGGALYFSGIAVAMLHAVNATDNRAGVSGGAIAVVDSTRADIELNSSTIRRNEAGINGGGLFLEDSNVRLTGVQLSENSAKHGGAVATSGSGAALSLQDTKCVDVDVLLDWTDAGKRCPVAAYGVTCDLLVNYLSMTCSELAAPENRDRFGFECDDACSGCDCNDECVCHR